MTIWRDIRRALLETKLRWAEEDIEMYGPSWTEAQRTAWRQAIGEMRCQLIMLGG